VIGGTAPDPVKVAVNGDLNTVIPPDIAAVSDQAVVIDADGEIKILGIPDHLQESTVIRQRCRPYTSDGIGSECA